jgi:CTP synthase (UTP-ammonia lyase)
MRIGLIGDKNDAVRAHAAIPRALELVRPGQPMALVWLPTDRLSHASDADLQPHDAFWCVPGSPYASLDGALRAIRFAREHGRPFLGTCGGFQHALIEYARNVLGLAAADHAESSPEAEMPLIAPLSCSLVGTRGTVRFVPGSALAGIYGAPDAVEGYHCSYGLNPQYRSVLDSQGPLHALRALAAPPIRGTRMGPPSSPLRISAHDDTGEVRAVELAGHPFFLATLFQPELSALSGTPHPLVRAFARAAERV